MLTLLTGMSSCYYPRIYIVANTDNLSVEKIKNFEKQNKVQNNCYFWLKRFFDVNLLLHNTPVFSIYKGACFAILFLVTKFN